MLTSLTVRNFAVISELRLALGPGLTVFTGETGAGKSIVIEALGFLLGARGSTDWIRAGAGKLEVEGSFGSVALRRELDSSGKSKAWIDGKPAALSAVAALAEGLADFHGQHEHQTLLKPAVQLELLDAFGGLEGEREAVAAAFKLWKDLSQRAQALKLSEEERLRRIDLYKFQVGEIDEVGLKPGEEEELAAALPRIKNAARLGTLAEGAHQVLYDQEGAAAELLSKAESAVSEIARLDPSAEAAAEALAQARARIEEAVAALARYRDGGDEGPEKLDQLLGRQDKLARLKKKYGASVEEVLAFRERVAGELSALENHAERSRELEAELKKAEKALATRSDELHEARRKTAKRLGEKIGAELKDLGLGAARFCVSVEAEEGAWSASGCDSVEFLIAPNPGEPLKGLRAVASGGELSRVMLALKTVLARQDKVGLLVFDEVDTGVGAVVGRTVGQKLAELGRSRQVLAVTHLPQVACFANAHFCVSKSVAGGRTSTRVEPLDGDRRLEVLASMLGGSAKPTEASRRHAKELLESL